MAVTTNALSTPSRPWPLGQQIGAVQVLEACQADAQGITYTGQWQDTGETVLLREYFPVQLAVRAGDQVVHAAEQAAAYAAGLAAFIRAVREAQAFAHPAYPDILGLWCLNGSAYVAMPSPTQPSLETTLRAQPEAPALKTLLRWLRAWGVALAPLHEQQLAHGGLNPFDLRLLPRHGMWLPALFLPPQTDGGGLPYVAPELALAQSGAVGATPASDVYALCAILYRAMAGQAPLPALARRQGLPWVAAADAGRDAYPSRWLQAVDAGLALEPVHRPATVQALLAACGLRPDRRAAKYPGAALHQLRPQPSALAAGTAPTIVAPPRTEDAFTHALSDSLRQVTQQARADNQALPGNAGVAPAARANRNATPSLPPTLVLPPPTPALRRWKWPAFTQAWKPVEALWRQHVGGPLAAGWKAAAQRRIVPPVFNARRGWFGALASLAVLGVLGLVVASRATQGDRPVASAKVSKPTAVAVPKLDPDRLPATAAGPVAAVTTVGPVITPKTTAIVTLGTGTVAADAAAPLMAGTPPAADQPAAAQTTTPQSAASAPPAALAQVDTARSAEITTIAAVAPVPVPPPAPAVPAPARSKVASAEKPVPKVAAAKPGGACADQLLRASLGDLAPASNAKNNRPACR